jgi:hypothetical protein
VNEHLNTFGLPALFSSLAGSLQQDSRFSLRMAYKANGAAGVRSFLVDQAESRLRVFKNSWEIASFLGWANSDWFCSEGFRG